MNGSVPDCPCWRGNWFSSVSPSPRVSVIIATYNRSHVLRHAVRSVRDSSFTDWELIVVGDACTDDTEACVASFGDPRIRFANLATRCGYQSGPHNHGISIARGAFVAFLNHDDFYLPDHLANCVAALESSEADLVWAPCAAARRAGAGPGTTGLNMRFATIGAPPGGVYSPLTFCPPTAWVLRRAFANEVGPWLRPDQTVLLPSQEWLFRASQTGTLQFVPRIGVIKVGVTRGSYAGSESSDHEWLAPRLKDDPDFRSRLIEDAAMNSAMQAESDASFPAWWTAVRFLRRPFYSAMLALGRNPAALNAALHFRARGSHVRRARRFDGSN